MHVNNEFGTIQPVEAIARIAHEAGVAFHSDGVQAAGKVPIDVRAIHADIYAISGHKIYAPKGTGGCSSAKAGSSPAASRRKSRERHRAGTQMSPEPSRSAPRQWINEHAARVPVLAALRDRLEIGILTRVADAMSTPPEVFARRTSPISASTASTAKLY